MIALVSLGMAFKIFEYLGYGIEAERCASCYKNLSIKEQKKIEPGRGGVICENCGRGSASGFHISNNAIKIMRIFRTNKLSALEKLKVSEREIRELISVRESFLRWIS